MGVLGNVRRAVGPGSPRCTVRALLMGDTASPTPAPLFLDLRGWGVPTAGRPQEAIWRPCFPSPQPPWQEVTGRAVPRGPQACEDSQWPGVPGGV